MPLEERNLKSQLSLKMTSMGLDLSEEIVMKNMRLILEEATKQERICDH